MMIQYLAQEGIDDIKTNFSKYKKHFQDEDNTWFIKTFNENGWLKDSKIQLPEFVMDFDEDYNISDKKNIEIVYTNLKTLSPAVASDERIWAGLLFGPMWRYVKYRRKDELENGNEQDIKNSFLFMRGMKRSCFINCLSRLWWTGFLIYDDMAKDPFHATEIICDGAFSSTMILLSSSSFMANKNVGLGLLDCLKIRKDNGDKIGRYHFVESTKFLNVRGAACLLDVIGREEIALMVNKRLNKIYGEIHIDLEEIEKYHKSISKTKSKNDEAPIKKDTEKSTRKHVENLSSLQNVEIYKKAEPYEKSIFEQQSLYSNQDKKPKKSIGQQAKEKQEMDDYIYSFVIPKSFALQGKDDVVVKSWRDMYIKLTKMLADEYKEQIESLIRRSILGNGMCDFQDEERKSYLSYPKEIAEGIYLETNLDPMAIIKRIYGLLKQCGLNGDDFKIKQMSDEKAIAEVKGFVQWCENQNMNEENMRTVISNLSFVNDLAAETGTVDKSVMLINGRHEAEEIFGTLKNNKKYAIMNSRRNDRLDRAIQNYLSYLSYME